MIGINLFSVIDLLALVISTHVFLVFLYRSIRVTKRRIDLLFTGVTLIVCAQCFLVLVSDNVVPVGVAAEAVSGAAERTLLLYRLMYFTGTLLIVTLIHFALRYTQSSWLRGWRAGILYAGALALLPIYFSDAFLKARSAPLQSTSGWWCAVPWQPDSGALGILFILLWVVANGCLHWLLWHRPRPVAPGGAFDQRNFVWGGITLWGIGGLVSMGLAAMGYAGVDPSMVLVAGAMVVLAIGLAEEHRQTEIRNGFIKEVFGRYVTNDVVVKLLESPRGLELGGERRTVTVLLSDIRGFTALAERLPPERVVEVLNIYLGIMADVITARRGTIIEFVGDGILAIFGAPIADESFVENAVRCAIEMQRAMTEVNAQIARLGVPPLEMGIGINTGDVVVGNIGSTTRAKYGVVGSNVNLAARIEAATVGGQILVSQSTVDALPDLLQLRGQITLHPKGAKLPLIVSEVGGIRGERPIELPTPAEEFVPLTPAVLVECSLVTEEKQVDGQPFTARVLSICQTSARVHAERVLPISVNLRVRIAGASDASGPLDLYGKIVALGVRDGECVVRFTAVPPEAMSRGANGESDLPRRFQELARR